MEKYTCILCPNCCELLTDGHDVTGARCDKGESFARQEAIMPLRVLTTTVRCETPHGVKMLPVKTTSAVPLAGFPEIMKLIRAMRLSEIPPIGSRLLLECAPEPLEIQVTGG
jgi:CxxC motif-containing protein